MVNCLLQMVAPVEPRRRSKDGCKREYAYEQFVGCNERHVNAVLSLKVSVALGSPRVAGRLLAALPFWYFAEAN
jgi:hypothetical protein